MERNGDHHGPDHAEDHCCQGQGRGQGHCGRHGHADTNAPGPQVPAEAPTGSPAPPARDGACCRGRD